MSVAHVLPNVELNSERSEVGLGGLRAIDGRVFPLDRVKVRCSVAGPCARTVVEQYFSNPFDETLDVTWIFPLPADGAIVELEFRAGDVLVVGECLERGAARATYDAAREQGKRAALVEKEQGDVHTLSLTGIPARSAITVRLTLVEMLSVNDGRFRWQFPTTIAPRYTPGVDVSHEGHGRTPDTDLVPNASRLTPPLRLAGGVDLDLEVEIAGPLSALESSLHAVKLTLDSGAVRVAPSAKATLNKDFILEFSSADSSSSVTRAWTDGAHTLVVLEPPTSGSAQGLPRDAVFVVDISGSMQGTKLDAAKAALRGAVHGLSRGDRFKLLAFDDRVERFRDDYAEFDDASLTAADQWIARLAARGGTEMLAAIQESLNGATPTGRVRTVLFITDGQSNDESRLLPAVANRRGEAVFFTLGIDTAVNSALLKSLARAGGGVCELCTPTDDIDAVVARLETRFGQALLSHIKVAGAARPDGQTVFSGRPASILVENASSTVEVRGSGPSGEFTSTVTPSPLSFPLGALWARERVAWLEERLTLRPFEEEAIRPEILRVALQWHISSKFTAFVGVDHSVVNGGAHRHVVQPSEIPESWVVNEMMSSFDANSAYGGGPVASPMHYASSSPPNFSRAMHSPSQGMPAPVSPMAGSVAPGSHTPKSSPIAPRMRAALEGILSIGKKRSAITAEHAVPLSAPRDASSIAGELARLQNADGSFGGDLKRTVAALIALLLLGNTRRKGNRRRTVQKAVAWLEARQAERYAMFALKSLAHAEHGVLEVEEWWHELLDNSAEGRALEKTLEDKAAGLV